MSEINNLKLCDLVDKIKNKKLSSKEITEAFINRSKKSSKLNSYITDNFDNALNRAKEFDEKPDFNKKIPGIPLAVKDLFCTKNLRTTAGSKILENFIPTYESTVTQNIIDHGGIIIGKLKSNLGPFFRDNLSISNSNPSFQQFVRLLEQILTYFLSFYME